MAEESFKNTFPRTVSRAIRNTCAAVAFYDTPICGQPGRRPISYSSLVSAFGGTLLAALGLVSITASVSPEDSRPVPSRLFDEAIWLQAWWPDLARQRDQRLASSGAVFATCQRSQARLQFDRISSMGNESAEQKWNRLSEHIRNLILTEYPNPDRIGCPKSATVSEYARRAMDFDETVEAEADYDHIVHCSPATPIF